MTKKDYQLLIVAHPDDETLYFGGLIQQSRSLPWHVICVTDGNGDSRKVERAREFKKACQKLKITSFEIWDFPDIYEKRIEIKKLQEKLKALPLPKKVFTHGILGEYGHPHHQDTSFAVHEFYAKNSKIPVYSPALNCFPTMRTSLTKAQFEKKIFILTKIYAKEFQRFANLIPCTWSEGFSQIKYSEIKAIYPFLTSGKSIPPSKLDLFSKLLPHIKQTFGKKNKRLF